MFWTACRTFSPPWTEKWRTIGGMESAEGSRELGGWTNIFGRNFAKKRFSRRAHILYFLPFSQNNYKKVLKIHKKANTNIFVPKRMVLGSAALHFGLAKFRCFFKRLNPILGWGELGRKNETITDLHLFMNSTSYISTCMWCILRQNLLRQRLLQL